MYIQIGFVGNGREGEKLCSSEVLYWSIFVSTGMNKILLTVYASPMNCAATMMSIMMAVMKTTSPN